MRENIITLRIQQYQHQAKFYQQLFIVLCVKVVIVHFLETTVDSVVIEATITAVSAPPSLLGYI